MYNQQQMLGGMGQLPDVPTQKELWKNERNQYRPWLILFAIGLFILLVLMTLSFSINLSSKNLNSKIGNYIYDINDPMWKTFFDQKYQGDSKNMALENLGSSWGKTYIYAFPIISLFLLFVGLITFAITMFNSYKTKSFTNLSSIAMFITSLGAMFSIFQLFWMIGEEHRIWLYLPGGYFQLAAFILTILVGFGIGTQVTRIKRIFMISARVEQIKNDPNYQAFQQQFGGQPMNGQFTPSQMGPFGPIINNSSTPNNVSKNTDNVSKNPATQVVTNISYYQQELEKMSIENLKSVAKKLSISGFNDMNKKELISNILRVTNSK